MAEESKPIVMTKKDGHYYIQNAKGLVCISLIHLQVKKTGHPQGASLLTQVSSD
jgi:hypothetical protein